MDYSIKKAQEDINLNNETSYITNKEKIEQDFNDLVQGKGDYANLEIFKDIIENGDQLENDIYILESKKKEVNDIVKELQNKITLHDIV